MAITLFRRREPFRILGNYETDINRWFGENWFENVLSRMRDMLFEREPERGLMPVVDIKK